MSASQASVRAGRHDAGVRRRSKRAGRERGCWVYVTAEELAGAGIDLTSPPPEYRAWPGRKRSVLVQLYAVETTS